MKAAKQPVSVANIKIFAFKQIKRIVKHAYHRIEFQNHFWLIVVGVKLRVTVSNFSAAKLQMFDDQSCL